MAVLPYSRVVRVTLSRDDSYPERRGFGIPLFLTTQEKVGKLSSVLRTRVYGSMEEVQEDWDAVDEFYKAAEDAFSLKPKPVQIKVGFVDLGTAWTADDLKDELDAIQEYDPLWYWFDVEAGLRDEEELDGALDWAEAHIKFASITSNDEGTETQGNTSSIAARNKGNFERTGIFYHDDETHYPGFAYGALLGTYNFDNADTAYTGKFKNLPSIPALNKGSAIIQAITGFQPALGMSTTAGHCANTYVDIGGKQFVVEGSTLTPNVFIDEIHASDWIISRTEEEMLAVLLNNDRVPFTDAGMEMLAGAARIVMTQAIRAGLIAIDLDENGDYSPAVEYIVPSVFDVPASQRAARIAPEIIVRFRYAGAVHYAQVHYRMTF